MTAEGEADTQAAELALGLLEGEERAAALSRVLADPDFAAEVERWRLWLAQLFDLWPEAEPPEGLIDRIDASLGGPAPLARGRRIPWPLLTIAATALAACLLVVVALRPGAPPPPPVEAPVQQAAVPPLVAALAGQGEAREALAATFDAADGSLRLTAAPPVPAGRAAQLWVIGGDGVPHPLGLLAADATLLALAPADRVRLIPGATLAVSIEPEGGSPTGKPTGPVIAAGALAAV